MEDILVVIGGATTPSGHCRRILEQVMNPTNAHQGSCNELGTHLRGVSCLHLHAYGIGSRTQSAQKGCSSQEKKEVIHQFYLNLQLLTQ